MNEKFKQYFKEQGFNELTPIQQATDASTIASWRKCSGDCTDWIRKDLSVCVAIA